MAHPGNQWASQQGAQAHAHGAMAWQGAEQQRNADDTRPTKHASAAVQAPQGQVQPGSAFLAMLQAGSRHSRPEESAAPDAAPVAIGKTWPISASGHAVENTPGATTKADWQDGTQAPPGSPVARRPPPGFEESPAQPPSSQGWQPPPHTAAAPAEAPPSHWQPAQPKHQHQAWPNQGDEQQQRTAAQTMHAMYMQRAHSMGMGHAAPSGAHTAWGPAVPHHAHHQPQGYAHGSQAQPAWAAYPPQSQGAWPPFPGQAPHGHLPQHAMQQGGPAGWGRMPQQMGPVAGQWAHQVHQVHQHQHMPPTAFPHAHMQGMHMGGHSHMQGFQVPMHQHGFPAHSQGQQPHPHDFHHHHHQGYPDHQHQHPVESGAMGTHGGEYDLPPQDAPKQALEPAKRRGDGQVRLVPTGPQVLQPKYCVAAYPHPAALDLSVAHGFCAAEAQVTVYITATAPRSGVDAVGLYRLGQAASVLALHRPGAVPLDRVAKEAATRKYVVLKSLGTDLRAPPAGGGSYTRFLKFKAPRGNGVFVFRGFDGEEFDKAQPHGAAGQRSAELDIDDEFEAWQEELPPDVGHSTVLRVLVQGEALLGALAFTCKQLEEARRCHAEALDALRTHGLGPAQQLGRLDTAAIAAAVRRAGQEGAEAGATEGGGVNVEEAEDAVEGMPARRVFGLTIPVLSRKLGAAAGSSLLNLQSLLHQTLTPPTRGTAVFDALALAAELVTLQRSLYSQVAALERLVTEGLAAARKRAAEQDGGSTPASGPAEAVGGGDDSDGETALGAALGVLDDSALGLDDAASGQDSSQASVTASGGEAPPSGAAPEQAGPTPAPLGAMLTPTLWLNRDSLSASATFVACLDDVIGNMPLLGSLAPMQQRALLSWRAMVCPFTDTLLALPSEHPGAGAEDVHTAHPVDGTSAAGEWHPRVRSAVTAAVQHVQAATKPAEGGADALPSMTAAEVTAALTPPASLPASVIQAADALVLSVAPHLFPSADFQREREELAQRVQDLLQDLVRVASGEYTLTCKVFGSSANSFGSAGSDVDLAMEVVCLDEGEADPWEVVDLMNEAQELLAEGGMTDISSRATARVPIMMFTDPTTGLQVDVGVNNSLAVRNTALLRAYAELDPVNVRALGMAIKHWAKAKDLNSPVAGSPSSYAWLLCLLSFLQRRAASGPSAPLPSAGALRGGALLPCLQALPPAGSGTGATGGIAKADIGLHWNWEDWTRWGGTLTTVREVPLDPAGRVSSGRPGAAHVAYGSAPQPAPAPADVVCPPAADWRQYMRNPEGVPCDTYFAEPGSAAFAEARDAQHSKVAAQGAETSPSPGRLLLEFLWFYAFQADSRRAVVSARPTPPLDVASAIPSAVSALLGQQAAHEGGKGRRGGGGHARGRRQQTPAPSMPLPVVAAATRFGVRWAADPAAPPLQHAVTAATACEPLKAWKVSMEGWSPKPTLAVEDPLETTYNVAHVVKPAVHHRMRAEMAATYATLVHVAGGGTGPLAAMSAALQATAVGLGDGSRSGATSAGQVLAEDSAVLPRALQARMLPLVRAVFGERNTDAPKEAPRPVLAVVLGSLPTTPDTAGGIAVVEEAPAAADEAKVPPARGAAQAAAAAAAAAAKTMGNRRAGLPRLAHTQALPPVSPLVAEDKASEQGKGKGKSRGRGKGRGKGKGKTAPQATPTAAQASAASAPGMLPPSLSQTARARAKARKAKTGAS